MTGPNSFGYFKTVPEILHPGVMLEVRLPLSLRNVEDLLQGLGCSVGHENHEILLEVVWPYVCVNWGKFLGWTIGWIKYHR